MALNQGPGRNIDFCLITTGLNIDPDHGGQAEAHYNHLKRVISQKAEIHYEDPSIREVFETDASSYLNGYNPDQRTVFQALWGFVQHSNGWRDNTQDLIRAIDRAKFPSFMFPKNGEISIDWQVSREMGFKLFKNTLVSNAPIWQEIETFYYSNRQPKIGEGSAGDVWLVQQNGQYVLYYKVNFEWVILEQWLQTLTPQGKLFYSTTDPGNMLNSWWLDTTGLTLRQYSAGKRDWMGALPKTISSTAPVAPNDHDLWIKIRRGFWQVMQYDISSAAWQPARFSAYTVLDSDSNSVFVGESGNNNFTIDCGVQALQGGPITEVTSGGGDLEIRKNGVVVQTLVDLINFQGPDLTVTSPSSGQVNVRHNDFTTLPTQANVPGSTTNTGKIYTQTINGTTELFFIDDSNNVTQLTSNGATAQNIFPATLTTSAVNGQTTFSVPGNTKGIITMKINGLDTIHFTLTTGSVLYDPITANYVIESGDKVTIIYYG